MKQFYFDEKTINGIVSEICERNQIELEYWYNHDTNENLQNQVVWESDIPKITVGPFDNLEQKFISFFEAFAGIRLTEQIPGNVPGYNSNNSSDAQYYLWLLMMGIGWAYLNYGIVFSDETINTRINDILAYRYDRSAHIKAVQGDKDHYVVVRDWSPLKRYRLVLVVKSNNDFGEGKQQLSDIAHEMHLDCEKDVLNEFRIFIPIETDEKEMMHYVSTISSLATKLDGDVYFEMDKVDLENPETIIHMEKNSDIPCYPDNSIKTASKKYPFNACVIGYSGKPVGGVDMQVLAAFEKSFKEIKTMAKDKDISPLERALHKSEAKYSCDYLNMLFSVTTWLFPSDSKERGKMDKMYEDLLNLCRSNKRYENAQQIVIDALQQNGFKMVKEHFRYGGQPQFVFTKNGMYYYVNSDQVSIFYLFRQGTHKFYVEWNNDIKDTTHHVKEIGGGLENLIKTLKSIKTASIARKVCLAYTKKSLLEFLRYKLSTDDRWALRALQRIYQGQTVEQLNNEETKELNNLGFTGFDAPILTSIYKSYLEHHNRLTPKQMQTVKNMMKKYAGQIYRSNYFDKAKMEKIYEEHLKTNLF